LTDRPIFLVGFMGSGKSTVGAALAERLGWAFLDTDTRVEERAGRTIEAIFREDGEARFRELEDEVVAGLDGLHRAVVATGGGLFLRFANRRRLRGLGHSVWLDVPLETCVGRVGRGAGRPLWDLSDRVGLRALFDRRAAVYALAETRLRVSTESADELVGRFLAVFH
jgi:shikimate kinase